MSVKCKHGKPVYQGCVDCPPDSASVNPHCYASVDECIRDRPESLTGERAKSFLPTMDVCQEWQRKKDAGELGDGLLGMRGMLTTTWPDEKPTEAEAKWMLALLEFGTWRWMGSIITHGDNNQITAMHLIEASKSVLGVD